MKEGLRHIHNDVINEKGIYNFYLLLLILSIAIVGMPEIPLIAYLPRLVIAVVGIIYLLLIYFLFKPERSRKQNRAILIDLSVLIVLAICTVWQIIR